MTPHLPLAVGLALAGAVCLGLAAVQQHGAVHDHASPGGGLGPRSLFRLVRRPRWLAGMAWSVVGAALALVALSLAPLSVVQPIGVLSVPCALLVHSLRGRRRATRGEVLAVAATVIGTAVFVWCVAGTAHSRPPRPSTLLLGAGAVALFAVLAAVVGRHGPRRWQALGWAAAGAIAYGLGTTMIKSVFLLGQAHGWPGLLSDPVTWLAGAIAVPSFALGVWAVQHAYLAGTPQAVVGTLTVVDPLVCVLLGFAVLGELGGAPAELAGMVGAAVLALIGVARLTHPPAAAVRPDRQLVTTGRSS